MEYDFSGWATRNNIKCSDGRTIVKDAFKQNDGQKVPLVWNHQHDDPNEVLGHAILENREDGVYAYCKFNDTDSGKQAKALVANGDIDKLSIYANKLKSQMNNVVHGCIREVSLVLAGANPGAFIDSVITHSDESGDEEEAVIYTDEEISLMDNKSNEEADKENNDEPENKESDDNSEKSSEESNDDSKEKSPDEENSSENESKSEDDVEHSENNEDVLTGVKDEDKEVIYSMINKVKETGVVSPTNIEFKKVFDGLKEDDQTMVYALLGKASEYYENQNTNKEGEDTKMKHNVFDKDTKDNSLVHSAIISDAIAEAKRYGSMKESFIEHAAANNIEDVDYLFPEAKELNTPPVVIKNNEEWVSVIMDGLSRTPFSRVKTSFAKMDEATARAKGYIKGKLKTDIAMSILKRVTTPTTVYIKNTIDRDDLVDITDFDVIAWQKAEMKTQLNKELALAILLGDGRNVSDDNKINEQNIRPIVSDDDLYTIKYTVKDGVDYSSTKANDSLAKGVVRAAIKARKTYKGAGKPTFFTTEDLLTDLLLIEDTNGRIIYDSVEKLATALRVKQIVTVPEMESRTDLYGVITNISDYTAGADKGGKIGMFDDFDIDYNQMKYLMETRMSGALTTPYSAIVLKKEAEVAPENPETQG